MENPATISTIDPSTGQILATYAPHSPEEVSGALVKSRRAFIEWRNSAIAERVAACERLKKILSREKENLAVLMQKEMGKLLAEGRAEIEKCIACAEYYAKEGPSHLEPKIIQTEAKRSYVCLEPLGSVLALMPWNFPFWQAIRCAVPALFAGNSLLLKHASNVSGCALTLEKIFDEAFARPNLFQTLLLNGKEASALIGKEEISAVSFTGSTSVGRLVGSAAGAALKRAVLELGGSDAYIVLADADIESAAKICAQSRLLNAGQSCIAAKRFIVEEPIYKEFLQAFTKEMRDTPLAPLARGDLRDGLHLQVQQTLNAGAKLICGGEVPSTAGYYYPPTILSEVQPGMVAFDEELFGPVAAVIKAKNANEAIELANQSKFGLGGAIFSKNVELAENLARHQLEAGSCFVNAFVRSDPRLPFGGIKESGYGRELSAFAMREFANIKTVYIG